MQLYSTRNQNNIVNLKEAVLNSYPSDKGLFMPSTIEPMSKEFVDNLFQYSFPEIGFRISQHIIGDEIPKRDLERICYQAINFPAPLKELSPNLACLELFHGPSLAFKDFGARFMAGMMSYFTSEENQKLTILVATSGDTGGAVAAGFHGIDNIEVIILYPSGRVTPLQEKQLTTWGDNIYAIEWDGTFDDCQAAVKRAFLDTQLNQRYNLSSANSINIARLIPQTFYYFEAVKQINKPELNLNISVPSGNLGNITAGSIARKLGLKIDTLIAAHNANHAVLNYYNSGEYIKKETISTISNAMDVGDPSNFDRLNIVNGSTWNNFKNNIQVKSITDDTTKEALLSLYHTYDYISEPHAAVAYEALNLNNKNDNNIFLGTAHPAKFLNTVESTLHIDLPLPQKLVEVARKTKNATGISSYEEFQNYMLNR